MQTPIVNLKGKTAIVTGGGRGIGRAVARRFSNAGANVVIAARTLDDLHDTRVLIERDGGRVLVVPCDVSEAADVERLIDETIQTCGRVDVLVNNAGTAPLATIDEMEPNLFDKILKTNIRTVYLCSRGVWHHMVEQGGGVIINTSSVSAYDAFPGFAAYGAAKAFVVAYTKFLAKEGADVGIRVYGVSPGAVETDMLRGAFPDFPSNMTLETDDVAVLFETLLSPTFQYSSGQTVTVSKTL